MLACVSLRTSQAIDEMALLGGLAEEGLLGMPPLDILFRQVPEGYEFIAVLLTILGSLLIMAAFGAWWSR
jgi:hypothetical protein